MSQIRHMSSATQSRSQLQATQQTSDEPSAVRSPGTLRLRGEDHQTTPQSDQEGRARGRIKWSDDVVDNEGMGKKSSKVCCIYHKPRPVGESSSESSSSSSSDSDLDSSDDCDYNSDSRHIRNLAGGRAPPDTDTVDTASQLPDQPLPGRDNHVARCCPRHHAKATKKQRKARSPNAYERMPKSMRRHR